MGSRSGSVVVSYLLLATVITAALVVRDANAFSSPPVASIPKFLQPLRAAPTKRAASNRQILSTLFATDDDDESETSKKDDENSEEKAAAERLRQQAQELREQIRKMEAAMPEKPVDPERAAAFAAAQKAAAEAAAKQAAERSSTGKTGEPASLLDGKRVLLVGANGRLGSMVCRRLLREYPEIAEVVAMVHVVFENSETARGYGRLSYEVGAEDGKGSIGGALSEDRVQTFVFDEEVMTPYNLQKLRVVECELLDPVQCKTIVEDAKADVVVWCATDFDGSTPRALSGGSGPLSNVPFLYRAVADPDKGRVEIEGLQNILGALKNFKQETVQRNRQLAAFGGRGVGRTDAESEEEATTDIEKDKNDVNRGVDFLLVSSSPDALSNFETPFGSFLDIKRQGEDMVPDQFPSFKYSVLQFATFEDNFVKEDLDLKLMEVVNEAPRVIPDRENPPSPSPNLGMGMGLFASLTRDDSQLPREEAPEAQKRQRKVRRINRRDAARAVGEALVDPDYHNKKIQVWTNEVG